MADAAPRERDGVVEPDPDLPTRQEPDLMTTTSPLSDGLRRLADFLDVNPQLLTEIQFPDSNFLVPVSHTDDPKALLAAFIRAALASKLPVRKDYDSAWGTAFIDFGGFALQVYASRDQVCERVVTGTREVTREVPDPDALAAVPTKTVTETVEDVEWICTPLLAGESVPA